jgi:hypothetical protein
MFSVSTPRSPLDGLDISKPLVLEFFAVFSRFEFALKEVGYNTVDHYKNLLQIGRNFHPMLPHGSSQYPKSMSKLLLTSWGIHHVVK